MLDALIAGVNIPELDPEETGIGYGALPNADGVVAARRELHARAEAPSGGCGGRSKGVRTPSLVAQAVMDQTDHHLLAGKGAQEVRARARLHDRGRPQHRAITCDSGSTGGAAWTRTTGSTRRSGRFARRTSTRRTRAKPSFSSAIRASREFARRAVDAGVVDGPGRAHSRRAFWGTINCNGINSDGDIGGVTTTSGLAWKIPGRVGDSPVLGAGLYVDNDVGAAGSTGRGEANLYNCGRI